MIGFSREQESDIERLLGIRSHVAVRWRTGALSRADAWWVNGARAQLLADGSLRVSSGDPGGRSVRLALADVSRPVAFSEPLADREFEPAYSFSISDPASVGTVLETLETKWLACTAVGRWIAGRLIAQEQTLTHRVYHLLRGDRLLAVIDRTGQVGWLPGLAVETLQAASWIGRPSTAGTIPSSFHRSTISELVWDYALRSKEDLVPARYRLNRIYFRRPPKIAPSLIGDDHLLVMRELVVRPASITELEQRTGLGSLQLAQALAALYFTGSITTNERRVQPARHTTSVATPASSVHSSLWASSKGGSSFGRGTLAQVADFTVPASLRYEAAPAGTATRGAAGGAG